MRTELNRRGTINLFVLALVVSCAASGPEQPHTQVSELPNGIRVVAVDFPKSTNVSIFTYTSMGLVSDEPGHAQWAHLVEHMVR